MSIHVNKTLYVSNVMLEPSHFPINNERDMLKEVLDNMDKWRLGICCIVDKNSHLKGVITDGDIRRSLLKIQSSLSELFINDAVKYMVCDPLTVTPETSLLDAIDLMEERRVWDLPVVKNNQLVGLLHLHPAIDALLKHEVKT